MRNVINRIGRVGAAVGAASLLCGCGLSNVGGPPGGPMTGAGVTITQDQAPSALLVVTAGPASGPALSALVASTARPREALRILQDGVTATTIVASDSPAPAQIVVPAPPVAPRGGATAYQSAQYAKRLKAWRAMRATDVQAEAAETREKVSQWLGSLGIPQKISRLTDPPGDEGTLAAESAVAASAVADLEEAGDVFGSRRVIVLFCDDLSGALPPGELVGDDVIVVTGYLPTAAAASAARLALWEARAGQAAVVGSGVTPADLATLVSGGLSQGVGGDSVSTPVLFGNDSYALSAMAVRELTALLPRLREPGVMAEINGFASTPGTAQANYILSYQRATAVAVFFESCGIPASSLVIVGHGATDTVGSGASGANRRVLVVIEESSRGLEPSG
jgi:outer membrane protein OmpA-like peptidoglycan-associated protein